MQKAEQFQTEGKFDLSKYQRWLASGIGQQYVPPLEAQYRDQIQQSKLLRVVDLRRLPLGRGALAAVPGPG